MAVLSLHIHEARRIRDAERSEPGITRRALDAMLAQGREPTKANLRRSIFPNESSGASEGPCLAPNYLKTRNNRNGGRRGLARCYFAVSSGPGGAISPFNAQQASRVRAYCAENPLPAMASHLIIFDYFQRWLGITRQKTGENHAPKMRIANMGQGFRRRDPLSRANALKASILLLMALKSADFSLTAGR